jgi:hypothetical protein
VFRDLALAMYHITQVLCIDLCDTKIYKHPIVWLTTVVMIGIIDPVMCSEQHTSCRMQNAPHSTCDWDPSDCYLLPRRQYLLRLSNSWSWSNVLVSLPYYLLLCHG